MKAAATIERLMADIQRLRNVALKGDNIDVMIYIEAIAALLSVLDRELQ